MLKVFLEHIGHNKAELRRVKLLFTTFNIAAFLYSFNNRRVRARAPDAHFLKRLYN